MPEIKLLGTLTTKKLKKRSTRTTRLVRTHGVGRGGWKTLQRGNRPFRRSWLRKVTDQVGGACWWGNRLRAHCGLQWLPWWESLPVSQDSSVESGLQPSRRAALFLLWLLTHRPHHSTLRRFALPWQNLSPRPLKLNRCVETKIYGPNERTEQNFRKS